MGKAPQVLQKEKKEMKMVTRLKFALVTFAAVVALILGQAEARRHSAVAKYGIEQSMSGNGRGLLQANAGDPCACKEACAVILGRDICYVAGPQQCSYATDSFLRWGEAWIDCPPPPPPAPAPAPAPQPRPSPTGPSPSPRPSPTGPSPSPRPSPGRMGGMGRKNN